MTSFKGKAQGVVPLGGFELRRAECHVVAECPVNAGGAVREV